MVFRTLRILRIYLFFFLKLLCTDIIYIYHIYKIIYIIVLFPK